MKRQKQTTGRVLETPSLKTGDMSDGATASSVAAVEEEQVRISKSCSGGGGVVTGRHLPALVEVGIAIGSGYSSLARWVT